MICNKPPGDGVNTPRIGDFLVLSGQFATYTYVTPFLAQVSGFGGKTISSILLGYTVIGLFGNFLGGAGAGKNVKGTFIATTAFVVTPMLMLPYLGLPQSWSLVLIAIWGLAYGAMPLALQTWMVKAAPNVQEGGLALFVANFQISIAIGSLVGGLVVDNLGLISAMYFGAAPAVLAILVIARFGEADLRPDRLS
jgi:predicted MFS family arabinose efflux permease